MPTPTTPSTTWPPWPNFTPDEIARVQQVLESGHTNYWTGEEGRSFEREYAAYVGVEHAVALANGSVGLELALRTLGIRAGDEVIVTPRSFIASASSIVVSGATPVFADVDRDSQNITAETIAPRITSRTRAILLVHLAGWPCDMDPILALAEQHGLQIIEDCAQAHGARYKGRPVGSFGDAAVFSFCQDKIISTGGEGGMLVTRHAGIWQQAWSYKDHGKNYDAIYGPTGSSRGAYSWVHDSIGSNLRMTEMQAAIGRIQLRKLDDWVGRRQENARRLTTGLQDTPALRVPQPPDDVHHAFYKFYAFLEPELLQPGWDRDRVIDAIRDRGIPCFGGACSEIYLEKAFADSDLRQDTRLSVARELGETAFMLQVHPTLQAGDIDRIVTTVRQVMNDARR